MNGLSSHARRIVRPLVPESLRRLWLKFRAPARLKWRYHKRVGEPLDLEHPVTFNDKIQWLKLHHHDPLYPTLVDKYAVRQYVAQQVGSQYLNDCYGVWTAPEHIEFAGLPDQFVLKTTHGSGHVVVCHDKQSLDWEQTCKQLTRWLAFRYGEDWYEWPYTRFKPRIIAERLLEDATWGVPLDYKFFCFHGEPRFVQVDVSRFEDHRRNLYDLEWNLLDVCYEYENYSGHLDPPSRFKEMLDIARRLAVDKPFCRVDLYEYQDSVLFGELTFFPESGFGRFTPPEWNRRWGELLQLPTEQ